jgi:hypothetical protein
VSEDIFRNQLEEKASSHGCDGLKDSVPWFVQSSNVGSDLGPQQHNLSTMGLI